MFQKDLRKVKPILMAFVFHSEKNKYPHFVKPISKSDHFYGHISFFLINFLTDLKSEGVDFCAFFFNLYLGLVHADKLQTPKFKFNFGKLKVARLLSKL